MSAAAITRREQFQSAESLQSGVNASAAAYVIPRPARTVSLRPRWITRRANDGSVIDPPVRCYDPASIAAIPGVRTLEECVRLLLKKDETIVGGLDQPRIIIKRGDAVVGYFEVVRAQPDPGNGLKN